MKRFSEALGRRLAPAVFVLTLIAPPLAAESSPLEPQQAEGIAIVGVHVVPMDEDRVLENQTVLVTDGRITGLGPIEEMAVPDAARRIEGKGRYLMPGLADLHVHIRRPDEYVNYLRWGVTTVMHLGGSGSRGRDLLEHRRLIGLGEMTGPHIYATKRVLDGDPRISGGAYSLTSPDDARARVSELAAEGFDFVKIYNNVSLPVFRAIVAEADQQGLPVFGHIPRGFDSLTAMREGQDAVVHSEEFFFTYFEAPRSTRDMDRSYTPDLSKIPALADALIESGVAVMPDLSFTFTNLLMWDGLENIWADAEMAYLHPRTASDWQRSNINRRDEIENFVLRGQWKLGLLQELTLRLQEAGVLQVIGTDASVAALFPGKSAHRELTELVKAGLSNFEALSLGTRNAGDFVRRYIDDGARFGRIAPGYRADLVLLEENPLEDVRNARGVEAVAVSGRWIERAELDSERKALADRYQTLRDLNEKVNTALGGDDPATSLQPILAAHADDEEMTSAIEGGINSAGYTASGSNLERAQEILELGTILFPNSANAWDSLGEILLMKGDRNGAIKSYRKALEVNPDFSNAAQQLEHILQDSDE